LISSELPDDVSGELARYVAPCPANEEHRLARVAILFDFVFLPPCGMSDAYRQTFAHVLIAIFRLMSFDVFHFSFFL
jgi:hypothetical protein